MRLTMVPILLLLQFATVNDALAQDAGQPIPFDYLFPEETRGSAGLNKLTPSEQQALANHVSGLLLLAVQSIQVASSPDAASPLQELDESVFQNTSWRRQIAQTVLQEHGVRIDWRKHSALELLDVQARLNLAKSIKDDYGISFDWQKSSVLSLVDAQSRVSIASRISKTTGISIDWRQYSLGTLFELERKLFAPTAASLDQGEWLLQTQEPAPPRTASAYAGVGEKHWIKENTRNGQFIRLEDDSLWEVSALDRINSSLWLPTDNILVVESKNPLYPYKLVAKRDTAEAKLVTADAASAAIGERSLSGHARVAPNASASVIESKVDGEFIGWEGETIVKLANGQIWQQSEYFYHYHYAFRPDVLIFRSGAGWKMKVQGVDRAVGVVRLQ